MFSKHCNTEWLHLVALNLVQPASGAGVVLCAEQTSNADDPDSLWGSCRADHQSADNARGQGQRKVIHAQWAQAAVGLGLQRL